MEGYRRLLSAGEGISVHIVLSMSVVVETDGMGTTLVLGHKGHGIARELPSLRLESDRDRGFRGEDDSVVDGVLHGSTASIRRPWDHGFALTLPPRPL